MVVSTTDYRSHSHRGDKSGPEVRTRSSLHLVTVSPVHLVVEILHLLHLVIMSLVYLAVVVVILGRTWSAAVRKFR